LAGAFGFGGAWLATAAAAAFLVASWATGGFFAAGFACTDVFFGVDGEVFIFTGTPLIMTVFCSGGAGAEGALAAAFGVFVAFFAALGSDFA